uniref:BTB domain-containing protein n=1 Tax=Panagrolaimus sp. ES5 TaxID=591445 RepID=A0AC34GX58_9BILA
MGIQQWQELNTIMEGEYEVPKSLTKVYNGKAGVTRPCNRRKKVEVVFVVDNERIRGEKLILTKRSSVFELMFEYGWGANPNITIPVTDTNSRDFTTFLEYLHRDKLHLTMDNAFELFKLAATYAVVDLQQICDEYLASKVELSTVLYIADGCLPYGGTALKKCMDLINEKPKQIFALPRFPKISSFLMEFILKQNRINISEEKLFEAFSKWGRCHSNHQSDELKMFIRFPLMDPMFLKNFVATSNILTPKEYNEVYEDAQTFKTCNSLNQEFTFSNKNRISDILNRLMLCKMEYKPEKECYRPVTPMKVINGTPKWKYTKTVNWKSAFIHSRRLPYISNNQI